MVLPKIRHVSETKLVCTHDYKAVMIIGQGITQKHDICTITVLMQLDASDDSAHYKQ